MSQEGESESHASKVVEREIAGVVPQAPVVVDRERKPPLEKIRKYGAKEFRASKDDTPEIAEYWLDGTLRVLEQLQCTPEDRLIYAMSLLIDEAYTWWSTVQQRVPAEQCTWQFFLDEFILDEFKKKFITEAYLDARRKEFLYLRQNRISVAEFEREFTRLSRYGDRIVSTEAERCKKL
ncbi:uncharacterized protein LOC119369919 [Jatropha curcas]|uniref:uncharacterized protein LOC119369919 n=1 Tax=Jatropha curcas TaxID=180498 RepID=UPI001892F2D3|nr:uncharacterized protein LOC119369919 [Jatropha curcas]